MDVLRFADVDRDGHAGVEEAEGFELGFAEERPAVVGTGAGIVGELDEQEGEVALAEGAAPIGDEGGEEAVIVRCAGDGGVGLALIPDGALNRVRDERRNHAVPQA